MQAALRRHDAILRAAIETNQGVVFKTIGDAFCATFARAPEGIEAALAAQRALTHEDFSDVDGIAVRMALHSGTADERDDDYYGPTINRVARLLSIGYGGQVLTSGITAELVRAQLPDGVELRDMGRHYLKDLSEAESVHQLLAPDLRRDFPALRSIDSKPNNLPRQLTSFVGRHQELAEVAALVDEHRLVTLAGPGGIGKTRLAVNVGMALLERFRDGVWLAELAPISEGALVPNMIAAAVGVQESPHKPMVETLVSFLKNKETLLILDNCEHVIEEAASVVEAILRACPSVRILATSREGLRVDGEFAYRLASLPTAEASKNLTADRALEYGSVALFVDRAAAADARFALTDDNAQAVAEICRRLDGIALAIELAAARVKVLSVKAIVEKLDERFRILTGGARTALPRQQTLRALIDWSYDILSEDERRLFRRLAIFAGDFAMELAAAIGRETTTDADALEIVASLVDKSLLQAEFHGDETRYRLLESTREYAREKLIEVGEFEASARAHAAAYAELAEQLEAAWDSTPDPVWNARAESELENWRAALQWALGQRGDVAVGRRLAASLRPAWFTMAPAEGRRWVDAGLQSVDAETPMQVVARLEVSEAHLALLGMQYKAASLAAERALAHFCAIGDSRGEALAQLFAGAARGMHGHGAEGDLLLNAALQSFRMAGARRHIGAALQYLATTRLIAGDGAGSRPLFGEALAVFREVGASRPAAQIAVGLAEMEFQTGDAGAAIALVREALETARSLNDQDSVAFDLCNLSAYLVKVDRWEEAVESAREALVMARERQFDAAVAFAIHHLAAVAALRPIEDSAAAPATRRRAARLIGFVDARFTELDIHREFTELQEYDRMMSVLDEAFGADAKVALLADGAGMSQASAAEEGLSV